VGRRGCLRRVLEGVDADLFFLLWFCMEEWMECIAWLAGAATYLYPFLFVECWNEE
jgi:hypothetical protein